MEILEDIVLGDLPNYLQTLKTPLTKHVRIMIEEVEEQENIVTEKKKLKFSDTPLCGMWADRDDMDDPSEYVRNLRKPRYTNAY